MKIALLVVALATMAENLMYVGCANAGEPRAFAAPNAYLRAVGSSAYAAATAHDPHYDDPALWPANDVKQAAYARQAWPKTRVLVWANPGKSAKDGWEVKYWLEDGKPATKPFDADTDLVFPDVAAGRCWISLTPGRKYQPAAFRHLTIGKGTCIIGHFSAGANVWIRAGGEVRYMDSMVGGKNTFVRNDNDDIRLVDHFFVNKAPTSSVEFLGHFSSDDNWGINSGIMIVGPGSEIGAGNRSDPTVKEKGTLVLLSGAYFTRRSNCDWGKDLIVDGKLMAGLPDRPLTSDARLGLGWKSKGAFMGSTPGGGRMPGIHDVGLLLQPNASMVVHSADPAKARLVINCSHRENDWGQIEIICRGTRFSADEVIAKLKAFPQKTDMVLLGKLDLNGVLFDDIRKGGIQLPDSAAASPWKNVFYGENSAGKPEELYRRWEGKREPNPASATP